MDGLGKWNSVEPHAAIYSRKVGAFAGAMKGNSSFWRRNLAAAIGRNADETNIATHKRNPNER